MQHAQNILGIETSCDETAAAVVADGCRVLSSIVASQLATHARFGGVVPELASREHLRAIVPVVRQAMLDAGLRWEDLSAIAVTYGPGLVGSLLVGLTYAKALCFARGLPLIAVNHVEGHIHAALLEAQREGRDVPWPAIALVVSGGHTHLFRCDEAGAYRLLGKTRDDAAGEAYDKVAKLLGFPYPGGPILDRLSGFGNPRGVAFTQARMKGNALDFSFSGLKTAVLRWTQRQNLTEEIAARRALAASAHTPTTDEWLAVTPQRTLDLVASFQHTVIQELLRRVELCATEHHAASVIISGGVAANQGLGQAARSLPLPVYLPDASLATDNAAMIASAAHPKWQRGEFAAFDLKPQPGLALG